MTDTDRGAAPVAPRLTPDQYVNLLLERQAAHPAAAGKFPPLLEWLIREGDEELVDMDAITASSEPPPKREPKPRTYLPASHWRERLARIDAQLDALNGIRRHDTDDPAAYGGIGVRQTPRQVRKYGERLDQAIDQHGRLSRQRSEAAAKLRRAEVREEIR